jgi:hypothetical protein
MARLKMDKWRHDRNNDARCWHRPETEQELRARLIEGGSDHKHVVPGGAYWKHVEIWKALRDGDTKKAEAMRAEMNRALILMGIG